MKCRNCKNKLDSKILSLGSQPISSVFYSKKKTNLKKYSLDLYQCKKCELIQFKKLAPLDDMYGTSMVQNMTRNPRPRNSVYSSTGVRSVRTVQVLVQ